MSTNKTNAAGKLGIKKRTIEERYPLTIRDLIAWYEKETGLKISRQGMNCRLKKRKLLSLSSKSTSYWGGKLRFAESVKTRVITDLKRGRRKG